MKKIVDLLLIVCLSAFFAVTAQGEEALYPVTISDHAGRTVTIAERPERIVSGYYISSSALIALGVEDRMVGIEAKADGRAIYRLSAPELIDLPSVGTAAQFDLEGCLALNPDLVVLPLKLKPAAETLEGMGVPVLLVNPESEEKTLEMLSMLASAAGVQERAEELIRFIAEQEAFLSGIAGEKPRVYLAGNSALLSTAGSEMYQSHMIEAAGGTNVASELTDTYWAQISYEQLLLWNPEVIVLASDAAYTVEDVLNDPNLADCQAVRGGRVIQMPGRAEAWDSPVPGGILGSVYLAGVLHPDEVPMEQVWEVVNSFYEMFYGFTYGEN